MCEQYEGIEFQTSVTRAGGPKQTACVCRGCNATTNIEQFLDEDSYFDVVTSTKKRTSIVISCKQCGHQEWFNGTIFEILAQQRRRQ